MGGIFRVSTPGGETNAVCVSGHLQASDHIVGALLALQSVSYTHLDEERQEIINIVTEWPGVSGAHDLRTRQSGPTRFIQIHLEMEDNPVSYTHLDVYKRQRPPSADSSTLAIISGFASEKSALIDRFLTLARRIKQKPRLTLSLIHI